MALWKTQQGLTRRRLAEQAAAAPHAPPPSAVAPVTTPQAAEGRVELCCMCRSHIAIAVAAATDPQEPEMVRVPPEVWLGLVESQSGKMQLVMCCSAGCLEQFVKRGVAYPPF